MWGAGWAVGCGMQGAGWVVGCRMRGAGWEVGCGMRGVGWEVGCRQCLQPRSSRQPMGTAPTIGVRDHPSATRPLHPMSCTRHPTSATCMCHTGTWHTPSPHAATRRAHRPPESPSSGHKPLSTLGVRVPPPQPQWHPGGVIPNPPSPSALPGSPGSCSRLGKMLLFPEGLGGTRSPGTRWRGDMGGQHCSSGAGEAGGLSQGHGASWGHP